MSDGTSAIDVTSASGWWVDKRAKVDIVSKIQISEGALAKCHTNRAWFNSPVQQPIDFEPWAVSPTYPNTTNRVVVQYSKES